MRVPLSGDRVTRTIRGNICRFLNQYMRIPPSRGGEVVAASLGDWGRSCQIDVRPNDFALEFCVFLRVHTSGRFSTPMSCGHVLAREKSRKHDWGWGEEEGKTYFTHCAVTCDVFGV